MSVTSRQRSLTSVWWTDERLLELPDQTRQTGIGLHFYVDDHGRGSATARLVRASLWPLSPKITDEMIDEDLLALDEVGHIDLYTVDGRSYLRIVEWPRVDRPNPSRIPPPPSPRDPLANDSRSPREAFAVVGGRKEGEEGGGRGGRPVGVGVEEDAEPSPFCSRHQPHGTDEVCGPCGGARKRHELWLRARTDEKGDDQ